eukprot:gene13327-4173_t
MMYESCETSNANKGSSKAEEILELLTALKKQRSKQKELEYFGENGNEVPPTKSTTNKAKLSRLLKLLKMLAFLKGEKTKNQKVEEEKPMHQQNKVFNANGELEIEGNGEESSQSQKLTSVKHTSSSAGDLESLFNMVSKVKGTNTTQNKVEKVFHERQKAVTTSAVPKTHDHTTAIESRTTKMKIFPATNATVIPSRTTKAGRYCELFEQEDECNSDKDCSWCNILDECVGRNKEDFRYCAGDKRNADLDQQSDPEMCSAMKSCSSCTKRGKCFWCEKTKSCHIYPFFGYIPHNCPANMWYYKECDVQLAIFIILFPLLMILLCMVVFYFCLRFCYYRKKMLKVQLFEKPELFERRKGKKVYFVGGDEEDDEESRSEQIRKKYNLPHEKEPLISP